MRKLPLAALFLLAAPAVAQEAYDPSLDAKRYDGCIRAIEADAKKVVEAIASAAKTGQIGDGKIFVYAIEHALRIRTGEQDEEAL